MHPAASIIFFTVSSGAGYGMLAAAGLLAAVGILPVDTTLAIATILLALALVATGLFSSLLHLGRPERAWRALSQWRSSWLSREGIAAVLSFGPALLFGAAWAYGAGGIWLALLGLATLAAAAVTVFCTAMIYASLVPIRQWHNRLVPASYLALSAMTGALWLAALAHLSGAPVAALDTLAAATVAFAFLVKEAYWRFIRTARPAATIASATGLGRHGTVRAFEAPHTEDNFLLKEMGFRIGRKHAERLRAISRLLGFAVPFPAIVAALLSSPAAAAALTLLAAASAIFGVLVERWLFFAEAKHTVTLYYGTDHAPAAGVRAPAA